MKGYRIIAGKEADAHAEIERALSAAADADDADRWGDSRSGD